MNEMLSLRHLVLTVALISAPIVPTAESALHLGFNDGGSTSVPVTNRVDAYSGMQGDGWTGEWLARRQTPAQSTLNLSVVDTTPFSTGSGNYLSLQYTSSANSNTRAGVTRAFDSLGDRGGVDASKAFSFGFDLRFDAFSGTFNEATDQFLFSTNVNDGLTGFAATSPIRIWYVGGTGWRVNDGNSYVSIPGAPSTVAAGVVYRFEVAVNPENETWSLVLGIGDERFESGALGWYADTSFGANTYLGFRAMRSEGKTLDWSLDNVQVIPEPSSLAFLFGGMILLGIFGIHHTSRSNESNTH